MQLTATDVAIYKTALKSQVLMVHCMCDYFCHLKDHKCSLSTE